MEKEEESDHEAEEWVEPKSKYDMASLPKFRKLSSFTRRIVSHYKRKEKQRRTSDFSFVYSFLCLASFNNTQQIFFATLYPP